MGRPLNECFQNPAGTAAVDRVGRALDHGNPIELASLLRLGADSVFPTSSASSALNILSELLPASGFLGDAVFRTTERPSKRAIEGPVRVLYSHYLIDDDHPAARMVHSIARELEGLGIEVKVHRCLGPAASQGRGRGGACWACFA